MAAQVSPWFLFLPNGSRLGKIPWDKAKTTFGSKASRRKTKWFYCLQHAAAMANFVGGGVDRNSNASQDSHLPLKAFCCHPATPTFPKRVKLLTEIIQIAVAKVLSILSSDAPRLILGKGNKQR